MRTELLLKHGGIWIDATVYMVDYIPNDIIKSKFFLFQTLKPGVDGKSISISSWFIKTIPNNPVLELTQELLYEYWKKHNYLCDYFLFHYFMQISMNYYSHFTDEMVKYTNELPHVLLLQLHKSYNESVYKSITTKSFVHKLTYKVSDDIVNDKSNYYNFLLNSND